MLKVNYYDKFLEKKKTVSSKDLHSYVSNLAPLWPPHSRQRTSSSSSSALALSSTMSSAISLLIASKSSMSWFHLDKCLPICRVSVNTTRLKNQGKLSQGRGIHWDRLTIRLFCTVSASFRCWRSSGRASACFRCAWIMRFFSSLKDLGISEW